MLVLQRNYSALNTYLRALRKTGDIRRVENTKSMLLGGTTSTCLSLPGCGIENTNPELTAVLGAITVPAVTMVPQIRKLKAVKDVYNKIADRKKEILKERPETAKMIHNFRKKENQKDSAVGEIIKEKINGVRPKKFNPFEE